MSEERATAHTVRNSGIFRILAGALEQKLPPLRALHGRIYQKHFAAQKEFAYLYAGVYKDFESALQALPPGSRTGCDHAEAVDRFGLALDTIWPSDYPVLFWLSTLLGQGATVFDLGGGLGRLFFGFSKYLHYAPDLSWSICEVPTAVRRGRELEADERLSFTTRAADAARADILIASGSLQLIETPLWVTLAGLASQPFHLLINRVPLSAGPGFVTLFNMGPAITPCQIWNHDDFIHHLEECGYSLIDRWCVPELTCSIPFHPERTIAAHTGMYLKRAGASAARAI